MKKVIGKAILAVFLLCLISNNSIQAAQNENVLPSDLQNVFDMYTRTDYYGVENGIAPRLTVVGTGGSATIDHLSSGFIQWKVKPATLGVYEFQGLITISLSSTGAERARIYIGPKYGLSGSSGDAVDLNPYGLRKGVLYKATLSGSAFDQYGDTYYVAPGATISFTY